jgi:hypothetical protein
MKQLLIVFLVLGSLSTFAQTTSSNERSDWEAGWNPNASSQGVGYEPAFVQGMNPLLLDAACKIDCAKDTGYGEGAEQHISYLNYKKMSRESVNFELAQYCSKLIGIKVENVDDSGCCYLNN